MEANKFIYNVAVVLDRDGYIKEDLLTIWEFPDGERIIRKHWSHPEAPVIFDMATFSGHSQAEVATSAKRWLIKTKRWAFAEAQRLGLDIKGVE